ncbi:hypothetical protein BgiBS90_020322 [Biomphalaria glabrata]|nr:hypothetical protein BgiBS90_020322 [Biomphalaria glabrata]
MHMMNVRFMQTTNTLSLFWRYPLATPRQPVDTGITTDTDCKEKKKLVVTTSLTYTSVHLHIELDMSVCLNTELDKSVCLKKLSWTCLYVLKLRSRGRDIVVERDQNEQEINVKVTGVPFVLSPTARCHFELSYLSSV